MGHNRIYTEIIGRMPIDNNFHFSYGNGIISFRRDLL